MTADGTQANTSVMVSYVRRQRAEQSARGKGIDARTASPGSSSKKVRQSACLPRLWAAVDAWHAQARGRASASRGGSEGSRGRKKDAPVLKEV